MDSSLDTVFPLFFSCRSHDSQTSKDFLINVGAQVNGDFTRSFGGGKVENQRFIVSLLFIQRSCLSLVSSFAFGFGYHKLLNHINSDSFMAPFKFPGFPLAVDLSAFCQRNGLTCGWIWLQGYICWRRGFLHRGH